MNRLVRIALTLFASSTILVFLIRQRLKQAEGLAEEALRNETQMASIGVIIAGALAAGGFVLIIIALARTRKKNLP
jgi:multisubunit Na+/H+ antiporter MnhB subunit